MKKRGKLVLLGVIMLAFVAVGSKPLWSGGGEKAEISQVVTTQTETSQTDNIKSEPGQAKASKLAKLLDDSFAKGKPVAVVYTYNSDC